MEIQLSFGCLAHTGHGPIHTILRGGKENKAKANDEVCQIILSLKEC